MHILNVFLVKLGHLENGSKVWNLTSDLFLFLLSTFPSFIHPCCLTEVRSGGGCCVVVVHITELVIVPLIVLRLITLRLMRMEMFLPPESVHPHHNQ